MENILDINNNFNKKNTNNNRNKEMKNGMMIYMIVAMCLKKCRMPQDLYRKIIYILDPVKYICDPSFKNPYKFPISRLECKIKMEVFKRALGESHNLDVCTANIMDKFKWSKKDFDTLKNYCINNDISNNITRAYLSNFNNSEERNYKYHG